MKKSAFFHIWLQGFLSFFYDPLWYLTALVTILVPSIRFFLLFFTVSPSCDLRHFFESIPFVAVLVIPLLAFRLRSLICDDSLPVAAFTKLSALALSVLAAFSIPLVLLQGIPLCLHAFGDIESGQLLAGNLGLLLYAGAAASFCLWLFSLFPAQPALALLFSSLALLFSNSIHLLLHYLSTGSAIAFLIQFLSFSWHFDAAGKGILDTRDICFYLFTSFFFILMAVAAEFHRTGRALKRLQLLFLALIFCFGGLSASRLYTRIDLTRAKRFSVSKESEALCARLTHPLRLTYYYSRELLSLYPETDDVIEYLTDYTRQSPLLTLEVKKISGSDIQRLQSLGVRGTQIRSASSMKTEYLTVYSTLVMQYREAELILPLILSTQTLEYDVTWRVRHLVTEKKPAVYVISGNGLSLTGGSQEGYGYLLPYLERMGFAPQELLSGSVSSLLEKELGADDELLVLGSSTLTQEDAAAIEILVKKGIPTLIATSPYGVAIADDWHVEKNREDFLIPALRSWGFAFENALVEDLSCIPLSLQTGSGGNLSYQTVNYPAWISVLPQTGAPQGLSLFWVSPLTLYGDAKALLASSPAAWIQEEAADANDQPFIANPFLLPKTAGEAGKTPKSYVLAASVGKEGDGRIRGYYTPGEAVARLTLLADQYFVSSLMTAYISHASSGDFRNFDFLAAELLRLRGDRGLSLLLQKKQPSSLAYKITDEREFARARLSSLLFMLAFMPALIIASFFIWKGFIRRKRRGC